MREDWKSEEIRRRKEEEAKEERRPEDEKEREKRWQILLEQATTSTVSLPTETMDITPTSTREDGALFKEKVPKFRRLEGGEDIEAYFTGFERHLESYKVPKNQWTLKLVPLLSSDANEVYATMDPESIGEYDTVKSALFCHYRVTQSTYRQKIDQLKRKSGETWTVCGRRLLNLMKRWAANCNSVEEVLDLMAMDHISKLIPRQIATWVRDRSPASLDEATTWVDDFINNRGWNWDVLSEDEHWKRKPFHRDE